MASNDTIESEIVSEEIVRDASWKASHCVLSDGTRVLWLGAADEEAEVGADLVTNIVLFDIKDEEC